MQIFIQSKIRAFTYSIHTEPEKTDASIDKILNNEDLPWTLFKTMPLKGLIVIRPHYLFKGQAFQLGQILNLSLWPHVLWNKQRETYGSSRRKVSSKLLYRG